MDELERALVPVEFDDGTKMYVEVIGNAPAFEPAQSGRQLASGSAGQITDHFGDVASAIKNLASQIRGALSAAAPHETQIEIGLDLKFEAHHLLAVLAKGGVSTAIRVTLKWHNLGDK
jgi:NTP-dependent ternary system trypsin peptidase co-occuring protein